jgi:flagellar basal-body rod protein FlgB
MSAMQNSIAKFVFDKMGVPEYRKYMSLSALRQKLISSNVANASTPGYQARDIDFQEEFNKATDKSDHLAGATTHSNHLPLGQHRDRPPEIQKDKVTGSDLNSVDVDREVSNLAQNELRYTMAARLLRKKFDGLRTAITSK